MQINRLFIENLLTKKHANFVVALFFVCAFGLLPHAAHAALKGGVCTSNVSGSWDSSTRWECSDLGYSATIKELYQYGYRVALISSVTKKKDVEEYKYGRDITGSNIFPILIIEQQQPPAPEPVEQKDYVCTGTPVFMRCNVVR